MRGKSVMLIASSLLLTWIPTASIAQPGPMEPREQQDMRAQGERAPNDRFNRRDASDDRRDWQDRQEYQRGPRGGDYDRESPMMGDGRGSRMMDEGRGHMQQRGSRRGTMNMMGPAMGGTMNMMAPAMGGAHMMGHADMKAMMMILMDTDSDGTVSLQEFLAAHERIFKAMDTNKDGRLTFEEFQNFRPGLAKPSQEQK